MQCVRFSDEATAEWSNQPMKDVMLRKFCAAAGWCCVLAVLFVTFADADLRPHLFSRSSGDRLFAFAVAGLLFGMGYPRHIGRVLFILAVGAVGSEVLQLFWPTRDPRLIDAVAKACGAVIGVGSASLCNLALDRWGTAKAVRAV